MAEPLPGYVDTGIIYSTELSGSGQFHKLTSFVRGGGTSHIIYVGPYTIYTNGPVDTDDIFIYADIGLPDPIGTVTHLVQLIELEPEDPIPSDDSASFSVTHSVGPLRLGVKYELIEDYDGDAPHFASHYALRYALFADENTVRTSTISGPAGSYTDTANSYPPGTTPVESGPEQWTWGGSNRSTDATGNTVASFSVPVSTDGLDISNGLLRLVGTELKEVGATSGTFPNRSATAGEPYSLDYDLDLPGFGEATSSGATLNTILGPSGAVPLTGSVSYPVNSWSSGLPSAYEALTGASSGEVYPANDTPVLIWGVPALTDPADAPADYRPVSVSLAEELDVFRPDGGKPSEFATTDAGVLTCTDGASTVAVTVTGPGGAIRRTFGATGTDLPEWRPRLGVGASGHGDAAFNPDFSHTTKHSSGTDIYDWSSYRYARVTLNNLTGGTQSLKLTARGVLLSISDSHKTGSAREDEFEVTETPYTAEYSGLSFPSGTHSVDVDLCFPDAGGPFYHGRIDQIEISGWTSGSFLLTGLKLVSKDPKTVWLKSAFGAPVQRGDYSALHAAHNGADFSLNLGDLTNKPEEVGSYGGALRYINILTGAETGEILDSQLTLQDYWTQLNSVEGWTATYNATAYEDANQDGFGNALGPELAQWSRQLHAGDWSAGGSHQPRCHPHARRLYPVPGITFKIYTRQWVGGAVDAILSDGDAPVPSTVASYAGASATSDLHGYVQWKSLDAGTPLTGHGGALTPRDKVRVLVTVPSGADPQGGVDLVQITPGWWFRASRSGQDIRVERSLTACATWGSPVVVSSAAEENDGDAIGSAPTLVRDPWDHLWCWFHDAGGAAQGWLSRDGGVTWSLYASHAGLRFPRVARQFHRSVVCGWDGSSLVFYASSDDGATLTALPALTLAAPRQLAALRVDRWGEVHLVYVSGGSVLHRWLRGDDTWSDPVTLASGEFPAYGIGIERGFVLRFASDVIAGLKTDEAYSASAGAIAAPAGSWVAQPVGAEVGEHAGTAEVWLMSGWDGETLATRYSRDGGASWHTPV